MDNNPLAPHALQTAVATMVERLLIEASYPAKGRNHDKANKRHIARERLADLIGSLTVADLPDSTVPHRGARQVPKGPAARQAPRRIYR